MRESTRDDVTAHRRLFGGISFVEASEGMYWKFVQIVLIVLYLGLVMALSLLGRRKTRTSNQFLNASGELPLWVCSIACIAANCGSLDVVSMMAVGTQYGLLAAHFYWIGAIPALLLLAFCLLPFYARGRYRSLLDLLARFYGDGTRLLAALCMIVAMLLLSGGALCIAAQFCTVLLGWSFATGVLLIALLVLIYTTIGGLRATLYTDVLHFFLVLLAVLPLLPLLAAHFGGVEAMMAALPDAQMHAWKSLPWFDPGARMDGVGLIFGLGMVLGVGYWSTDFIILQRILAVRRSEDPRHVIVSLAVAKLFFAFVIVLPGIAAPLILGQVRTGSFNTILPRLMLYFYPKAWGSIAEMGLAAALIATFANNISGFSAAWVEGIYRTTLRKGASEQHYILLGRVSSAAAVLIAVGGAALAATYSSLMEYMQMIFSTFNAPLLALVLLAVAVPRRVASGGVWGFSAGLGTGLLHRICVQAGLLHFGSRMTSSFYTAILGFVVSVVATLLAGYLRRGAFEPRMQSERHDAEVRHRSPLPLFLVLMLTMLAVGINLYFW